MVKKRRRLLHEQAAAPASVSLRFVPVCGQCHLRPGRRLPPRKGQGAHAPARGGRGADVPGLRSPSPFPFRARRPLSPRSRLVLVSVPSPRSSLPVLSPQAVPSTPSLLDAAPTRTRASPIEAWPPTRRPLGRSGEGLRRSD
eukprot:4611726-Pleurochrysis_carterae.AAC.1